MDPNGLHVEKLCLSFTPMAPSADGAGLVGGVRQEGGDDDQDDAGDSHQAGAGGVAHDFNNLLTAILGYCELLTEDMTAEDPHRNDVLEIQAAGARAAGLTRQLLAFSRKEIIEPTVLDLNAVVAGMRVMLERLIREDVTIVMQMAPDLPPIEVDRGQLEQIVLNLALNARDAMPSGGTLTMATTCLGPDIALVVTDTGAGMTPEVQSRIFEPFFTTKPVGQGTGLGLASVQGVVARCGGRVDVTSARGQGTTFTVHFPPAPAQAPRPSLWLRMPTASGRSPVAC